MSISYINKTAPICLALAGLMMCQSVRAEQEADIPILLPIKIKAAIDANADEEGSEIAMNSHVELGPCKAKVTFKRNHKSKRKLVVVGDFDIDLIIKGSSLGTNITLPKQPNEGGVGGNPLVYVQLHDGKGNNLTEEHLLGRTVQGLQISADVLAEALVRAKLQADGCSNPKGPNVNLDCNITLSGLHARYIFRNNEKGLHTAEEMRDVTIIMDGSMITVPKRPRRSGVGPNPVIFIQILDDADHPMGAQVKLGRCSSF